MNPPFCHVSFENHPLGPYRREQLVEDWGHIEWAELYDRAFVVTDGKTPGRRVLRVAYPKGSVGPQQGGISFVVTLPCVAKCRLEYRVKFEPGFDFRRGGKLPGLSSGGGRFTGGVKPEKGEGWSARFMWRENGQACVYLYSVDMPGRWGEDLPLGAVFVPDRWYKIAQRIRLNGPQDRNGLMEIWLDDRKVLSRDNIRYRMGEQGWIDSFYFSTFHGGHASEWAPKTDSFALFDDFVIRLEEI